MPRSLGWAEPDRWYAVEDGPCAPIVPPDPTCAGGQVRAGIAACLEAFDSCYALDSGEYCGVLR